LSDPDKGGTQILANRQQARAEFEAALKVDSSLPVAHVALGNLAIWDGDFLKAADHFSASLQLRPSAEIMVNGGQAFALAGRTSEAEVAYRRALQFGAQSDAVQFEAHLALGNLFSEAGKNEQAAEEYQLAQAHLTGAKGISNMAGALMMAQVKSDIKASNWLSASEHLPGRGLSPSDSKNYLAWLIGSQLGVTMLDTIPIMTSAPFYNWLEGDVYEMVAGDLVQACITPVLAEGSCVYDQRQLLDRVPSLIASRIHYRLFFNNTQILGIGQACPYVYTFDTRQNLWQFDTTILYKLVGSQAKTTQAQPLARFDGRLLIREIELEVSYIDSLEVRLIGADGREIILKPNEALLSAVDNQYLVLHQGDQQVLTFNVPKGVLPAREATVIATGYYVPVQQ
jgi:tetratricopeptide (TPR) repeat protein